ncbi:MAG: DUF2059 domain-containing protein [Acidobacteria bacterium]|nr:DUF2059 domain-containing protein [Acidobacteriota bacterium]MBS1865542.1 DUF2059 domain-containing protein [Acidobacteriota bacterium]
MKILAAALCAFALAEASLGTTIHTPSPNVPPAQGASSTPAQKVDPAKEADIRKLLDLVGTRVMVMQTVSSMSETMKPLLKNSLPPGDYREKLVDLFFERFMKKMDPQHLLDLAVPIYDKNFTHQEIKSLIEFYQTPLGQKTVTVLPKLSAELQQEGGKWGEQLGRETMMEILAEHPEIADAIAAAQKNAAPQK